MSQSFDFPSAHLASLSLFISLYLRAVLVPMTDSKIFCGSGRFVVQVRLFSPVALCTQESL